MNQDESQKVLVIDDDPQLLQLMYHLLSEQRYIVHLADDGEQGLRHLAEHVPDVTVTDIVMSGMDAIEFLRALHRSSPSIPMIVMSGHSVGQKFLQAARLLGAQGSLLKPFSRQELLEVVNRALSR